MVNSLVTGGLGFIGSHIVDVLIEQKHTVIVLDNEETGNKKNANKKAKYIKADIRDYEKIKKYFKNIDYVFHVAALPRILPSFDDPVYFLQTNVAGTINVLRAAKEAKVKRVVYSSSSAAYGNDFSLPTDEQNAINPLNPYGAQKYEGELYCKIWSETYGMSIVVLRYFNVYGPRSLNPKDRFSAYSSPVMIFLKQKREGKPLTITWDGEQKRDYVYVEDVARANFAAAIAQLKNKYELFNIGSGENHTVNEIAAFVGGPTIHIPARAGEARVTLCDNTKALTLLDWKPRTIFSQGIKACIASEEKNYEKTTRKKKT